MELHNPFTLHKHEWDSIALDRVEMACNPAHQADVAAVIMHEGLANVCLITEHLTINRQKIEHTIPRKRKGFNAQHEKGMEKFFDTIIAAIIKHINFAIVKVVIIASPGFVKDQFFQYMLAKATKEEERHLLDNRAKFILLHSSNGFKHALTEILQDPLVANRLSDTKAAGEIKLLDEFMQLLNDEPDKAYYGLEVVERANQAQAVACKFALAHTMHFCQIKDTRGCLGLLITDELFRNIDFNKRRRYVQLVDSVKDNGGDVRLFSRYVEAFPSCCHSSSPLLSSFSMHVSGERLSQLTGIAAILRYPMPDLDLEGEGEEVEQQQQQPLLPPTNNGDDDEDEEDDDDDDEKDLPPNDGYRPATTTTANYQRAEASAW